MRIINKKKKSSVYKYCLNSLNNLTVERAEQNRAVIYFVLNLIVVIPYLSKLGVALLNTKSNKMKTMTDKCNT